MTQSQSLGGTVAERPARADAGVVADHVHLAERRDGRLGRRLHRLAAGDVGDHALGADLPLAQIRRRRAPAPPASISASITAMPSAPKASAIDKPMPLAPPVMKATLPFRSCIGSSL